MIVRRARPQDERQLSRLALHTERRVLHTEWDELRAALRSTPRSGSSGLTAARPSLDLLCGEDKGEIGCLWASALGAGAIAHLTALILHDRWPVRLTMAALLPWVKRALLGSEVQSIAFVGIQAWLLEALAENGFEQVETVITLQKTDGLVPDPGNQRVQMRTVQEADIPAMIAIDRRAFIPLWQNTRRTLAQQLAKSAYAVVAEIEQQIVGYAYAGLHGRHGHLTRLAVHPRRQGQGIGIRLLAESIAFLQRQGVYGITLNTQQSNARSLRLYSWFGFHVLGQEAQVWTYR